MLLLICQSVCWGRYQACGAMWGLVDQVGRITHYSPKGVEWQKLQNRITNEEILALMQSIQVGVVRLEEGMVRWNGLQHKLARAF